jgi:tetratricopeptide (TPR) repeat protein
MLIAPLHLNAYVPAVPATSPYIVAGLAAVAAVAIAAWRGARERRAVVTFLCVWLAVTLAPSLLVLVRRSASAVLAERYLYLPSVAFVILAARAVAWLGGASAAARRVAIAALAVLALAAAWSSARRSEVWADDLVFWRDVAAKSAGDAMARRELASALMRRDLLDEARGEFEAALALDSSREDRVMAYNNLGNLHLRRDELDAAERSYQAGLALYPHPYLLSGLGRLAMKRAEQAQTRGDEREVVRQVEAARDFFQRALAADPNDYKNHVLLGQVFFTLRRRDEAREHLETALRIEPRGRVADTARDFLRRLEQ